MLKESRQGQFFSSCEVRAARAAPAAMLLEATRALSMPFDERTRKGYADGRSTEEAKKLSHGHDA
jgi:hypothetical protein